jgi:hypothetical protein
MSAPRNTASISSAWSGTASDLWVSTRSETASKFAADVHLDVCRTHEQLLRIRVDGDELDTAQSGVDHSVDGVDATTADADDLDYR